MRQKNWNGRFGTVYLVNISGEEGVEYAMKVPKMRATRREVSREFNACVQIGGQRNMSNSSNSSSSKSGTASSQNIAR